MIVLRSAFLLAVLFAATAQAQSIQFDAATYDAEPGDTITIRLAFGAPIPNGLDGYYLRLNYAPGLLQLTPGAITVVPELDNDLFATAPATRTVATGFSEVRGFSVFGSPYMGTDFIEFTVTVAPGTAPANYPLLLTIPEPNSFIDGNFTSLDGSLILGTATLSVTGPATPPPVTAPRVLSIARAPGTGIVTILFAGTEGTTYTVEASTNLTTWEDLDTITFGPTGQFTFTDSTSLPRRFYRLVD